MTTFRQYMALPEAEKEHLFLTWCQQQGRQPWEDGVGDDFLADYCVELDDPRYYGSDTQVDTK